MGPDPQIGSLHADRPGRASLALDLMDQFRAPLADRAVLTIINRRQVSSADFHARPGGAVEMKDTTRKTPTVTYQKKQESLTPSITSGADDGWSPPDFQARLSARHLNGDLDQYVPFLMRRPLGGLVAYDVSTACSEGPGVASER